MMARTLSTIILLTSIIGGTLFGAPWFFLVVLWVLLSMGLYEFWQMSGWKGHRPDLAIVLFLGAALLSYTHPSMYVMILLLTGMMLFVLHMAQKRPVAGATAMLSGKLFSVLYFFGLGYFFLRLRLSEQGVFWILWTIVTVKANDIGAYLVGKMCGRTLMSPVVSPKKTWEGVIGGTLFSIGIAEMLYHAFAIKPGDLSPLALLGLIVILNLVGVWGDLCESLMKRDLGVKDSGRIIPGIGGVLDLLDSLLVAVPVAYFYLHIKGIL